MCGCIPVDMQRVRRIAVRACNELREHVVVCGIGERCAGRRDCCANEREFRPYQEQIFSWALITI